MKPPKKVLRIVPASSKDGAPDEPRYFCPCCDGPAVLVEGASAGRADGLEELRCWSTARALVLVPDGERPGEAGPGPETS